VARADLVLLHAPSVYDFRESSIMFGPVSDVVPSTPIFEMYPIGLTTIAEYVERHGVTARIVNLAVLMLRRPGFDVEKRIRELDPVAFGIDLHWLPHAHGAIEIARICKKHHPDTPVIIGGLTASYFHEELASYPCVDYVVRGDSTEELVLRLMLALKGRGRVDGIPNLTYKDSSGSVCVNPMDWVPGDMDSISMDYSYNMRAVIRDRDMAGAIPFKDWLSYPVCGTLTSRGCNKHCVTCGGSCHAYAEHFGRQTPAFRDPDRMVADIAHIQKYVPGPVFVLNDPLMGGEDYARRLIEGIGSLNMKNPIAFEFFRPPAEEWWEFMDAHLNEYSAELSAESHDEGVRAAFGKKYSTESVEESIAAAFRHGCKRFDLYFMTGIPTQTADSVLETADYARGLYEKLDGNPNLLVFTSPMAPTLDPGSMVFDDPDHYGYTLRARTLEEHRQLLTEPSWKHILNYEPDAMTRDELVDVTYEAAIGLNRVKAEVGAVDPQAAEQTETRIMQARQAMKRIDEIMAGPVADRQALLKGFREEVDRLNESTVCEKKELKWPARAGVGMVFNVAALWVRENLANIGRSFGLGARSTSAIDQTEV